MRFKNEPEDFIVKEILPEGFIKKSGNFEVYRLVKRNIDTLSVVKELKNKFGEVGYAGLKDKHGLTTQYITMARGENQKSNNYSIEKVGYSDIKLERGANAGNSFEIRVEVTDDEKKNIEKNSEIIRKNGFKNYYDTQRTGHELEHTSMVHYLLMKDYKTALLRYYIHKSKYANKKVKLLYKECFKNWDDPVKCYTLLKGSVNNLILNPLNAVVRTHDYLNAILKIPKEELELLVAGYQAIIFNKDLDNISEDKIIDLAVIELPKELGIKTRKGRRATIVKPKNLEITFEKSLALLSFELPKGAYATILLKELVKA
ncbi:putative tRNA pseudouridine synthase D [Candidatus Tiddalikarchaeum anstoanum]|nr:putative tRNA pseudouridine synthase D [Candidatus Tiddalikarchaeum anstoanum]